MTRFISRLIILAALVFSVRVSPAEELKVEIKPDHADYFYRVGETAVFSIDISGVNPGSLRYRFSQDNVRLLDQGELELTAKSAKLDYALDRPGFLRLDLQLTAGSDTLRKATAVGFSPEAIRPTNVLPDDYLRFWSQGIAELMRIPVDARCEEAPEDKVKGARRYQVSLANVEGSRVYGWLTVPPGSGPFPAVVHIPGAPGGVGEYMTGPRSEYAEAGMIILALNIHGVELGRQKEFYQQLLDRNPSGGFSSLGADDPYRYYYRRVALGAIRAFDYLCTREDVDTTRLAVAGGSQGGGLALIVASLDKRIKAASIKVPAMCEHTGILFQRPTGWPHLLKRNSRGERIIRTSRYYDGALAAGLIEVPTLVSVSLLDEACPPTTVYSAFNSLKGPREIFVYPNVDHPGSFTAERDRRMIRWLAERLKGS